MHEPLTPPEFEVVTAVLNLDQPTEAGPLLASRTVLDMLERACQHVYGLGYQWADMCLHFVTRPWLEDHPPIRSTYTLYVADGMCFEINVVRSPPCNRQATEVTTPCVLGWPKAV
jgi:hypothetical protein